jgi:hypothetical protein
MNTTTRDALQLAAVALAHSAPVAAHYPEARERHEAAQHAVRAALEPSGERADAHWRDTLGALCARIEQRAAHQGWKGKARDKAALEMAVGALGLLQAMGSDMANPMATWAMLCLGMRGFSEVEVAAQEWRDRGNSLPER